MARQNRQGSKETRAVFLSFEFDRDGGRRGTFIQQAKEHCEFALIDKSLPDAEHSSKWRQEVKKRMQESDVVIVLLGQDTQNAPGVKDELSLAGEAGRPVVQLMPQDQNYGLVAGHQAICEYTWKNINEMLRNPKAYAGNPANRGK